MTRVKLLLHACCGPCLLEPLDRFIEEHDVTICYANPNIHPAEEYRRRRDTLSAYAARRQIAVIEVPYAPEEWDDAVRGIEGEKERRCRACFALRLGIVAREAAALGFDAVATTLSVSPYQDLSAVDDAGHRACDEAGVEWLGGDMRDRYADATRRSRELGMYRQGYCGCGPSVAEAEVDREERRRSRKERRGGG